MYASWFSLLFWSYILTSANPFLSGIGILGNLVEQTDLGQLGAGARRVPVVPLPPHVDRVRGVRLRLDVR